MCIVQCVPVRACVRALRVSNLRRHLDFIYLPVTIY